MSHLILLHRVLKKQNFLMSAYFQQLQISKISQCAIWQQKAKKTAVGHRLELHKNATGYTDISTEVKPLAETIKQNTETASYVIIILVGLATTAVMGWAIFRELFSTSSPNNIYSDALQRVIEDPRVQDSLGAPIKGFGEESRRGRRTHVAHTNFERDHVPHIRMKFYVQGIRNKATVHLESRKTASGEMEYRYLFVQLDHYPNTTIILQDNRASDPVGSNSQLPETEFSLASFRN